MFACDIQRRLSEDILGVYQVQRVLPTHIVAHRGPIFCLQEPHQGLLIGWRSPFDVLKELFYLSEVVNLFKFVAFDLLFLCLWGFLWDLSPSLLVLPHGCLKLCLEILLKTPVVDFPPHDLKGIGLRWIGEKPVIICPSWRGSYASRISSIFDT